VAGKGNKWAILNPRTGQILAIESSEAGAWREAIEEWEKLGLPRAEIGGYFVAAHAGKGFEWDVEFVGLIWCAKLQRKTA
jgi:hypothetical protein